MASEMQPVKKKDAEKEKNTATLSKISNAIKGSEKLDVEGTDLLELLSHLEGELQARDVAIAALKSEQVSFSPDHFSSHGWSSGEKSALRMLHRFREGWQPDGSLAKGPCRGRGCQPDGGGGA